MLGFFPILAEAPEPRFASIFEADSLVHVRAQGNCSGVPIKGTSYVVTAAHCVLDNNTGKFAPELRILVEYRENTYRVSHVLVQETPPPVVGVVQTDSDIAILVLTDQIPDIGVDLGQDADLEGGGVIVVYQSLESPREFYRPKKLADQWRPPDRSPGVAPAACEFTKRQAKQIDNFWLIPCSMLPGGSGGPVFSIKENEYYLVGILSSVSDDMSYNGVAPISIVETLLSNQSLYTHDVRSNKVTLEGSRKANTLIKVVSTYPYTSNR